MGTGRMNSSVVFLLSVGQDLQSNCILLLLCRCLDGGEELGIFQVIFPPFEMLISNNDTTLKVGFEPGREELEEVSIKYLW